MSTFENIDERDHTTCNHHCKKCGLCPSTGTNVIKTCLYCGEKTSEKHWFSSCSEECSQVCYPCKQELRKQINENDTFYFSKEFARQMWILVGKKHPDSISVQEKIKEWNEKFEELCEHEAAKELVEKITGNEIDAEKLTKQILSDLDSRKTEEIQEVVIPESLHELPPPQWVAPKTLEEIEDEQVQRAIQLSKEEFDQNSMQQFFQKELEKKQSEIQVIIDFPLLEEEYQIEESEETPLLTEV